MPPYSTLKAVRKALEKKLRQPLLDEEWEWLLKNRDAEIRDARYAGDLKWLLKEAKKLLAKRKDNALPEERKRRAAPSRRLEALTRIMAAIVNRDQEITAFRQEVLGGRLLSPEEVPKWVEEQAAREGHTLTLSFDVSPEALLHGEAEWKAILGDKLLEGITDFSEFIQKNFPPHQRKLLGEIARAISAGEYGVTDTKLHYLDLASGYPEHISFCPKYVFIRKGGVLWRLKKQAKRLEGFWDEAEAVSLILTGQAMPIHSAEIRLSYRVIGVPRITLKVAPYLKPEEVAELYVTAKRGRLPGNIGPWWRVKHALTEKHLALAVFVAEERGSWSELMEKWNAKYPQWRYKKEYSTKPYATFARDARAAFERVTGWPLEWVKS